MERKEKSTNCSVNSRLQLECEENKATESSENSEGITFIVNVLLRESLRQRQVDLSRLDLKVYLLTLG